MLRKLINEETEYRSGPELVKFFNDLGFNDTYEQGFPSRHSFTDDKLKTLNNRNVIDKVINKLFDPINFIDKEDRLNSLIIDFNKYLEFDGYQIVKLKNKIEVNKLDARVKILDNYTPLKLIKYFKQGLIADVRNNENGLNSNEYTYIRDKLIKNYELNDFIPDFIKRYEEYHSVIDYIISEKYDFQDREIFINKEFKQLLNYLENSGISIINKQISFSESYIHDEWKKAIQRNTKQDYDGAITSARTMLESLFKYILCEINIIHDDNITLPELYKLVTKQLKLSPDDHNEQIFKQILSGIKNTVEGLGSMRNKFGDSHGKSPTKSYKPKERHSELAVNLAGTLALFIYKTYKESYCDE